MYCQVPVGGGEGDENLAGPFLFADGSDISADVCRARTLGRAQISKDATEHGCARLMVVFIQTSKTYTANK